MAPKEAPRSDDSSSSGESSSHDVNVVNEQVEADFSSFFFLSENAAKALPKYQYKGQDLSLMYKYVLSPIAAFCVNKLTPRSVAPNTITLTGLLFMVASYLSMWYYTPMVVSSPTDPLVPRWVFLFNAMATLIYQTFDNMDGKQARRVGASSPLGLLFDHGCDAVNSLFGSANWMITLALTQDDHLCVFVALFGPYALMYVSTWEEFYTGELIMPIINGPNEGLLGSVSLSLLSYWYGPGYWQQTSNWDMVTEVLPPGWVPNGVGPLRNADLLILVSSVLIMQEVISKSFMLSRDYGLKVFSTLFPFATLVFCFLLLGWKKPDVIFSMPRTCLHLCAILFVEMTTELMLLHVTNQVHQYGPFRWILFPLLFATLVAVAEMDVSSAVASDFLIAYASAAGTYLCVKFMIVIHELCCVLDIWCFDITTPRLSRKVLLKRD